jgi:hypothetical protein
MRQLFKRLPAFIYLFVLVTLFSCTKKVEEKILPCQYATQLAMTDGMKLPPYDNMVAVAPLSNRPALEGYDGREKFVSRKSIVWSGKYPPLFYPGSLTLNKWIDGDIFQIAFNKARVTKYHLAFIKKGPNSGQSVPDINGNSTVVPLDHYTLTVTFDDNTNEVVEVYAKRGTVTGLYAPPATPQVNIVGGYKQVKYVYESMAQPYYNFVRGKLMNRSRYRVDVDGVIVSQDYLSGISTPTWRMDHKW